MGESLRENGKHIFRTLVLCQLHNFLRGTLHLYERKGLHGQILKIHIEHNNVEAALDTCRQFGYSSSHEFTKNHKIFFSNFSGIFLNSNFNFNCSNLLDNEKPPVTS